MAQKKPVRRNIKPKKKDQPGYKEEPVEEAFDQALKDIQKDPDNIKDENEDLDEGELANKEGHP